MFDTKMKKAQLINLRILSSVLLLDKSQDLDECQVDCIDKQKKFGKLHIQHGLKSYLVPLCHGETCILLLNGTATLIVSKGHTYFLLENLPKLFILSEVPDLAMSCLFPIS